MAYTALTRPEKPNPPLRARIYPIDSKTATQKRASILTLPFDFNAGDQLDSTLQAQLYTEFNTEVERGLTYPYEHTMTPEGFQAYFLASDLVLGLFLTSNQARELGLGPGADAETALTGIALSPDRLSHIGLGGCASRAINSSSGDQNQTTDLSGWSDTYAFSYYIKPNYPARGNHNCNAGFIVSANARGLRVGVVAGRSYLYYGPACGYRASVFNLVYTSNQASMRIWEGLGFTKVGVVPKAGRLRKQDGEGEEYVDAWVVHGDFEKLGTYR